MLRISNILVKFGSIRLVHKIKTSRATRSLSRSRLESNLSDIKLFYRTGIRYTDITLVLLNLEN